jgi:hypothetical protein
MRRLPALLLLWVARRQRGLQLWQGGPVLTLLTLTFKHHQLLLLLLLQGVALLRQ